MERKEKIKQIKRGWRKNDVICCIVLRYCLVICGRKAIHEALITRSTEFADRPEMYLQTLFNPNIKGCGDHKLL